MKFKPIINTNGSMLTKELLIELKKASVYGFTFHIDSRQRKLGYFGTFLNFGYNHAEFVVGLPLPVNFCIGKDIHK